MIHHLLTLLAKAKVSLHAPSPNHEKLDEGRVPTSPTLLHTPYIPHPSLMSKIKKEKQYPEGHLHTNYPTRTCPLCSSPTTKKVITNQMPPFFSEISITPPRTPPLEYKRNKTVITDCNCLLLQKLILFLYLCTI